jgi:chloride channel protein, CIC family
MWWPAFGGAVIGLGGLVEPHALGVGYDNIGALLAGEMGRDATLRLMILKSVIWAVALGAPFGGVAPVGEEGLWALIGMAAMMGGTMRSLLTAIVFALGLTQNTGALLPLATACAFAHATTVLLLRRSILSEKVARRGCASPAQELSGGRRHGPAGRHGRAGRCAALGAGRLAGRGNPCGPRRRPGRRHRL